MKHSDPAMMTANELLVRYRDGSLSPLEATEAALARIRRYDEMLNGFCLVDEEAALDAAEASTTRWRHGRPEGRLDGVPTTVKDIILTTGWPTLRGSKTVDPAGPWADDAPTVARLKSHGAVLIGKTTTPEFGWKGVTDSPLTGVTRNPWDATRTTGGSSGGAAAAAAAGMGALHIGTDGGGSIRIPASFTGVFGFKQTFGRVPAWPLSPFGTIAHVGPMARSVADCALMLTVMAEPDPRDPYALPYDGQDFGSDLHHGLSGLRVAYLPTLCGVPVDAEVAAAVRAAAGTFESLGARVEQPEPDLPDLLSVFQTLWYAGAARLLAGIPDEKHPMMDPGLRKAAAAGARLSAVDYLTATARREDLTARLNRLHQTYDLLILPTMPLVAFGAGQDSPRPEERPAEWAGDLESWCDWTPFTWPFNLTGQPAMSLPCGYNRAALPIGLQIVGPRYADTLVLRAAAAFESAHPPRWPDLA